jgi:protein-tyrosine-phosphatase
MDQPAPLNILFICRHNSVRSQIAEALATKLGRGRVNAMSAGPEPAAVPDYVQAWVGQLGLGSVPTSKGYNAVDGLPFDLIITLCDKSHAALPELAGDSQHIRWDFHHADSPEAVRHLEIELAERLRLMLMAHHLI